ncbi:hypothetical protein F2Q69_00008638 [Brassica cretica]|uniref:Uncharacterized protein n=1 Tax=Brassica cretica TaxID=69181 RepID=A0A8S9NUY1_BRACR|nr:hypothetical protein F2Q69_00008638 [Brassica cretica]
MPLLIRHNGGNTLNEAATESPLHITQLDLPICCEPTGLSCVATYILLELHATDNISQVSNLTEKRLSITAQTYAIEAFACFNLEHLKEFPRDSFLPFVFGSRDVRDLRRRFLVLIMEEQCMVICGEWDCGGGASWDFVIDERQMARLVPLYEGISLVELEGNVLKEFRVQEGDFKHMKVRGAMNLFAKFEKVEKQEGSEHIDDSGMGFVTPARVIRKESFVGSGVSKEACASTGVSKLDVVNHEDEEFVRAVEKVEETIKSRSRQKRDSEQGSRSQSLEGTVDGSGDVDERDIRPRGYDKEFWSPLLKGDFGGSNAVDVVYNADEIVAGLTKKDGLRTYMCTINNAFDHMVEVG